MSCNISPYVAQYDLIGVPQGADFNVEIIYEEGEPPQAVDLSEFTAKLQVRQNYGSPVLLELSTADGSISVGSVAPNIVLHFVKDVTSAMTVYSDMIYDLEITSSTNVRSRVLQGKFSLSREVTQ